MNRIVKFFLSSWSSNGGRPDRQVTAFFVDVDPGDRSSTSQ